MADNVKLVKIYAGEGKNGPVYEELPAVPQGKNLYKILKSPGLVLNIAKGDVVKIRNCTTPPEVILRGGNFCIQIYTASDNIDMEEMDNDVRKCLGGSLDGVNNGNLTFSVPAKNGLKKINGYFDAIGKKYNFKWYYANIYKNLDDLSDETLLDWWVDFIGDNER